MTTRTTKAEFVFAQALLHTRMMRKVDQRLSLHGISFTEYAILSHLADSPEQSMRRIDLAEAIGITASGVTRLLSPMEKTGLVKKEKNERDARVSLVKLSNAGATIFSESTTTLGYAAEELLGSLTENQLETLLQYMNRMM